MVTAQKTNEVSASPTTVKRRGLIAGAAALIAGIAATQTSQPVAASSALQLATAEAGGTLNGPVIGPTFVYDTNAGYTSSEPMLTVSCRNGPALAGLRGTTFGIVPNTTQGPLPPEKSGVYGDTDSFVGVLGGSSQSGTGVKGRILSASSSSDTVAVDGLNASTGVRGIGVRGTCDAGFGIGVQGESSSYFGVLGVTDTGIGVIGDVKAGGAGTSNIGVLGRVGASVPNSQSNTVGVYGQNIATGNGGIGVRAFSSTGIGLVVEVGSGSTSAVVSVLHNGSGPGMVLYAPQNHGIVASTAKAGYGGFNGNAIAAGAAGVIGTGSNGAYAGYFTGPVVVNGTQIATGTKSAAVPHPDGTHRLLYCMEAPEAWFEDFGEGTLSGGKGEVKLDPDFAATVDTSKLHVFLTPHDDGHNLHLSGRSGAGFSVTASATAEALTKGKKAADVSGTFTYRVVAKRKDVKAERLAKFTLPTFAPPALPSPIPEKPAMKM